MRTTYLAAPYSNPDPALREARFQAACRTAADLIRAGKMVFSPLSHSHPIARYGLPSDWGFWEPYDRRFLEVCDEVAVLTLEGWQASAGVQAEIQIARQLGKPVRFIEPAEENPDQSRG